MTRLELVVNWPNDNRLQAIWSDRCRSGVSFKNCYVGFGGCWMVKLFIGGAQRVLGTCNSGVHAARFADMAITHFHPYRKRRLRPLIDSDLNFGVAQAQADLLEVPEAKKILIDFEFALITRNLIAALPPAAPGEVAIRNDVLRHKLGLQHQQFSSLITSFKQQYGKHPMVAVHLEELDKTLDRLRVQIKSLDLFFLEPKPELTPPTPPPQP